MISAAVHLTGFVRHVTRTREDVCLPVTEKLNHTWVVVPTAAKKTGSRDGERFRDCHFVKYGGDA